MTDNHTTTIINNYNNRALNSGNVMKSRTSRTYELKAFNNWVKSILINKYGMEMCRQVENALDLRKGSDKDKILHVLDIGCGRGQDIMKWAKTRVNYMVATDLSEECLKEYEKRWTNKNRPYRLSLFTGDFTQISLYNGLEHSYYDIVSAQFCFHYMFETETGLKNGLSSILSNLLVGGYYISTIPDSYTILKKLKEKGELKDNSITYGNKYFSIKLNNSAETFKSPFGAAYGFYLQDAVGHKYKDQQSGEDVIQYVPEWLVSLDALQRLLVNYGVQIESTMNFLDFYLQYRQEYKELFQKFNLVFTEGQSIQEDMWEIIHLYRVVICRKHSKGKKLNQFNLGDRKKSIFNEIRKKESRSHSKYNPYGKNHQHRSNDHKNNDRITNDHRGNNHRANDYSNNQRRYEYGNRNRNQHKNDYREHKYGNKDNFNRNKSREH